MRRKYTVHRRMHTFACLKSNYLLGCYGVWAAIFLWNSKWSHAKNVIRKCSIQWERLYQPVWTLKRKNLKSDLKADRETLCPRNFPKLHIFCQRGITFFLGWASPLTLSWCSPTNQLSSVHSYGFKLYNWKTLLIWK